MLAKVQREDEKQAMMAGLQQKALTSEGVEKHLVDFGLEGEAASHTTIQSLSGGQKVKVVLGASMWLNPHILILDEPTNYLDRDGLGALTLAIKDFEGGVIIISHNKEFCGAVAEEKWIMQGGRLRQEGESKGTGDDAKEKGLQVEKEVKLDAMGNVIAEKEADMDPKKRKKEIKAIEKQLKDNKKKGTLSQEEVWELEDKLAQEGDQGHREAAQGQQEEGNAVAGGGVGAGGQARARRRSRPSRSSSRTTRRRERCRRRRCGSWRTSSRSSRRLTHERKHRWDAFVAIR